MIKLRKELPVAKKYTQLTEKERYHLELLLQDPRPCSQTEIAKILGRDKSTISRELKRNKRKDGKYCSEIASALSASRRKREVVSKFTNIAKGIIEDKLKEKWTPEQISSELKSKYNIFISHELIYQHIDNDRKLGGALYKLLPHRGNKYKKRNIKVRAKVWKKAPKRVPISKRPNKRKLKRRIGNWEGDTIEGKGHHSGLGTFVDMKSKYVIIRKLMDKSSSEMKNALVGSFIECPDLISTLTVDNGGEFALHDEVSSALQTKVYFSNPYSPWERGLSENTNGLIRRFFPKGTDFNKIPEWEVLKVQELLNNRPRKTLGFKTPKQVFVKEVLKNKKYAEMLKI